MEAAEEAEGGKEAEEGDVEAERGGATGGGDVCSWVSSAKAAEEAGPGSAEGAAAAPEGDAGAAEEAVKLTAEQKLLGSEESSRSDRAVISGETAKLA